MEPVFALLGCLVALVAILAKVYNHHQATIRLRKLGSRAKDAPHHLPLGLDLMWSMFSHMRNNTFIDYSREILNVPGGTVELNILGSRMIFTREPKNIKTVMLTQFSEFGKGKVVHDIFKNVLGDSVFSTDGPAWVANKNELRPFLAKSRPDDRDITEAHIQQLFQRFRANPDGLEVYDVIDRLQLDVVTHVFFGESTDSLSGQKEWFQQAMDVLLRLNSQRVAVGAVGLLFPEWLVAPIATRNLNRYMDSVVDKTLALPRDELKREEGELTLREALAVKGSSRKYIRDQLITVLLAAKDPTAILITWAIFELSRHPVVTRRLRAEIQETIGLDVLPEPPQLKTMKLLRGVVRETMRLYHPLGINVREAKTDTCLPVGGGPDGTQPVAILKGQQIAYSVIGAQRTEEAAGKDPETWLPDRWDNWQPEPSHFIPFNMGPRICLGRNFGQFQMEYTLVRILQEFEEIEWCGYGPGTDPSEPMGIKIELNTKCDKPVICKFRPARNNIA